MRNFLTILMLSQGVPMMIMGDEARQTQFGNNNAYCQDNEITWFDWTQERKQHDLIRFTSELIAFRKEHGTLRRSRFFTGEQNERGLADIAWHGARLYSPGWDDPESRVLAYTLAGFADTAAGKANDMDIHVMMNMDWDDIDFEVPAVPGRRWYRAIDTGAEPPADIFAKGHEPVFDGETCRVRNRSIVVLISKP